MIWLSRVLRTLAVAIAVLAAIDPSIPLTVTDRPVVALVGTGDDAFTAQVSRALADRFVVHDGPIAGAAATVIAGATVPPRPIALSGAVLVVTPPRPSPRIEISALTAPATASAGAKTPVTVRLRLVGLKGRSVVTDLYAGALAVDTSTRVVASDDEAASITMNLPPAGAGPLLARVVAHVDAPGAAAGSAATLDSVESKTVVDIRDTRWRVLVVDPRPSWTSTFVRRALEADGRFDVASRVETSSRVGVQSGAASSLTDRAALAAFDAVVIGGPNALGASEVRSLELFARERGGAVVLLLDQVENRVLDSLIGGVTLTDVHGVEKLKITSAAGTLEATELAVPRQTDGLTPLAEINRDGADQPAIWQTPLGAGRVVVNGALDAWRNRARDDGSFARFWVDAISGAAAASPPPLTVDVSPRLVAPGASVTVRAVVRDAQLSDPARPAQLVELAGPPEFWPAAERGVFVATTTAPDTPGNYDVRVKGASPGGAIDAVARYTVDADPELVSRPDLVAAWATAHGGTSIAAGETDVATALETVVSAQAERVPTRVMRSVWWLPAFVLLLGGEWWLRRRRGER